MKKRNLLLVICVFTLVFAACGKQKVEDVWVNATVKEDTTVGEGEKTVVVDVVAHDKTVKITVNTDAGTLGEALLENKLIEGEKGAYGMYIKKVIGMEADYNKTKTYWAITKDGEYMAVGADGEKISGGEKYEFTLTEA